jgi:hypothetical protein
MRPAFMFTGQTPGRGDATKHNVDAARAVAFVTCCST